MRNLPMQTADERTPLLVAKYSPSTYDSVPAKKAKNLEKNLDDLNLDLSSTVYAFLNVPDLVKMAGGFVVPAMLCNTAPRLFTNFFLMPWAIIHSVVHGIRTGYQSGVGATGKIVKDT